MAEDAPVRAEIDGGGVGVIRFNRPDAANSIDLDAARAFAAAAEAMADARAVIIRSSGRFFSAGGDLRTFAGDPAAAVETVRATAGAMHAGLRTLRELEPPVIAEVQGIAAGAGFSIAIAADLVVAAAGASFVFGYTAAALSPDGGASHSLVRLVGAHRAFELASSNRRLEAAEAREWGLVNHVVADEELVAFTDALAAKLADGPRGAFGALKRLLANAAQAPFEQQLDLEADTICERAGSAEGQEGIASFLEKRPPDFRAAA